VKDEKKFRGWFIMRRIIMRRILFALLMIFILSQGVLADPEISSARISPTSPVAGENITGYCNGSGDAYFVDYNYEWLVDSVLNESGTLSTSEFILEDLGSLNEISFSYSGTLGTWVRYAVRNWVNGTFIRSADEPNWNVNTSYEFETGVLNGSFNYSTYTEPGAPNTLYFALYQYNFTSSSYVVIDTLAGTTGCQIVGTVISSEADFINNSKMRFKIDYNITDANPSGGSYGCGFGNVSCDGETFCKPNIAWVNFDYNGKIPNNYELDIGQKTDVSVGENWTLNCSAGDGSINSSWISDSILVGTLEVDIDSCSDLTVSSMTYYLNISLYNQSISSCMNITASDIVLDCQGNTIDGVFSLNDDGTDNKYAVHVADSNVVIRNCTFTEWQTGIFTQGNNTQIYDNIFSNMYGYLGVNATAAVDVGGNAIGVLAESSGNSIYNNDFSDFYAGTGGSGIGDNDNPGVSGGVAVAILLNNSNSNNIYGNVVDNLTGGTGGVGSYRGVGGTGGFAAGLYFLDSDLSNATDNNISYTIGGFGGGGGGISQGGTGGLGLGVHLDNSVNNNFVSNSFDNLFGGEGGTDTNYGVGANGTAAGFWFKSDSYDNIYTSLSGSSPNVSKLNLVDNNPILVFYNSAGLLISDIVFNNSVAPVFVGGGVDTGSDAGISAGVVLIDVTSSEVSNVTITGIIGMPGAASGGIGGDSAGVYLLNSSVNITDSLFSFIYAGIGGEGHNDFAGGTGGSATGVLIENSTGCFINGNDVSQLTAGTGGGGGYDGPGGVGGVATGLKLINSYQNIFSSNNFSDMHAGLRGRLGLGPSWKARGANGTTSGIWLDNESYNNVVTQFFGGVIDKTLANRIEGGEIIYVYLESDVSILDIDMYSVTSPMLIGGSKNFGSLPNGIGEDGGISTGVALINSTNVTVENVSIGGFYGMSGAPGGYGGTGASGEGGSSVGVYITGGSNNKVLNSVFYNLTGGLGGSSGQYNTGGGGGLTAGALVISSGNNFSDNIIYGLVGGDGGKSGYEMSPGTGGIAAGFRLEAEGNVFISNNMSSLFGGTGGEERVHATESPGTNGSATAFWLKNDSVRNVITDSSGINYVGGVPIIGLYDDAGWLIENLTMHSSIAPIFVGGGIGISELSGVAVGILLVNVTNSVINNVNISGFKGMPGASGSNGGDSFGIYAIDCVNNNVTANIFNLTGGDGGHGKGLSGDGYDGGDVHAVYYEGSSYMTLSNSRISSLFAGIAGAGTPTYGQVGDVYAVSLDNSENNTFYNNLLNASIYLNLISGNYTNVWNITLQEGSRVYSDGTHISGNYYTNSSGNGPSDNCTDSDYDGFCDSSFTVAVNNIDYMPMSDEYFVFTVGFISPILGQVYGISDPLIVEWTWDGGSVLWNLTWYNLTGGSGVIVTDYNASGNYTYGWNASSMPSGNYTINVATNPSENSSEFIIDNILLGVFDLPIIDNYYEGFTANWSVATNSIGSVVYDLDIYNGSAWNNVEIGTSNLSKLYDPDFEGIGAKFRMRARDQYVNTSYVESNEFNISLEIVGYSCLTVTPVEGSTVDFNVTFNVTVPQNASAITSTTANLTQGGNSYESTGCIYTDVTSKTRQYTCTIPFQYFYDPGAYNIYVEASTAGVTHSDTQATYCTYNELTAVVRDRDYVEFSSPIAGIDNVSVDVPVSIRNLGNSDITLAELTAYDVPGTVVPSQKLLAEYFRAGNSLLTSTQLEHNVAKNISFTINNGENATLDFYLWVSAPADLYPQPYLATTPWSLVLN